MNGLSLNEVVIVEDQHEAGGMANTQPLAFDNVFARGGNIEQRIDQVLANAKALENAEGDLVAIAGQHPVITRAKKSIAAFG